MIGGIMPQGISNLFAMGGFTMYLLAFCSVLMLAVVIDKIYNFRKKGVNYPQLLAELKPLIEQEQLEQAKTVCQKKEKGADIFGSIFTSSHWENLNIALEEEKLKRDKDLPILGTMAVISPFLGLFGTVLGIMRTFSDIAAQGSTNPAVVSKGVAEALINTAVGLFIAIFSVIFFNLFKAYNRNYLALAKNQALKLMGMVKSGEDYGKSR